MGAAMGGWRGSLLARLRRVGMRNLETGLPGEELMSEREQILRQLYRTLGWQLAEFCQMPKYTVKSRKSSSSMTVWSAISPQRKRPRNGRAACWW